MEQRGELIRSTIGELAGSPVQPGSFAGLKQMAEIIDGKFGGPDGFATELKHQIDCAGEMYPGKKSTLDSLFKVLELYGKADELRNKGPDASELTPEQLEVEMRVIAIKMMADNIEMCREVVKALGYELVPLASVREAIVGTPIEQNGE